MKTLRTLLLSIALSASAFAQTWDRSTALEASHVIKVTSGGLHRLIVYNSNAADQYLLIFDSATLPGDGALTGLTLLVPPIRLAAKTTTDIPLLTGAVPFVNGLTVCNSSTDTTKTIGAADCRFQWYVK